MQNNLKVTYKKDGFLIEGFINSDNQLECAIYKQTHSDISNIKDTKSKLLDLLKTKLDCYDKNQQSSVTIIGHNIRIVSAAGELLSLNDLDDEVYEISQSILDGNDAGDIEIVAKQATYSWEIVNN